MLRRTLAEFKPDLILSDFTLPGFDGLTALEVARELAPETPFIFLSGTLGEERAIVSPVPYAETARKVYADGKGWRAKTAA